MNTKQELIEQLELIKLERIEANKLATKQRDILEIKLREVVEEEGKKKQVKRLGLFRLNPIFNNTIFKANCENLQYIVDGRGWTSKAEGVKHVRKDALKREKLCRKLEKTIKSLTEINGKIWDKLTLEQRLEYFDIK